MLRRPVFRAHYRVTPLPGEGVLLVSESGPILLRGEPAMLLAPLLDGTHSADDVVDALADRLEPAVVYYTLRRLEAEGYLAEASDAPRADDAWWHALGAQAGAARARLATAGVGVLDAGLRGGAGRTAVMDAALRALVGAGLCATRVDARAAGEPALLVALTDDYLDPALEAVNRARVAAGRPWLLARPAGTRPWLGPLFLPGETGCWSCLESRLRRTRPVRAELGAAGSEPLPALPASLEHALTVLALHLARWIAAGEASPLRDSLLELDPLAPGAPAAHAHPAPRRPQCPACGDPGLIAARARAAPTLVSRPRQVGAEGGLRSTPPEAFLERWGHLVDPLTGVAPELRPLPLPGVPSAHAFASGPNVARPGTGFRALYHDLRQWNGGKGATATQARASALGEAIERWSGVRQGDETRRRATLRELGEAGIDPRVCLLFSDAQYRDRDSLNARDIPTTYVPPPFDPDAPADWSPLWSLTRGECVWLPSAYLYYGAEDGPQAECTPPDSNGAAAGATLEDALLQGLLELVERDAAGIWWYNRIPRPALALASLEHPWVEALTAEYASTGRDLRVLDLTTDLGIPVFAAVSAPAERDPHACERPGDVLLGLGAHLDARAAALRALTELNQVAATLATARELPPWIAAMTTQVPPHLRPAPGPARSIADYPALTGEDVLDDVATVRAAVERAGPEVLVLDLTRPDIRAPVVKVVAPGLRHFWTRFAPGRLFQVPVVLGWQSAPVSEHDLNPVPLVL